jgi:hypothetical protein
VSAISDRIRAAALGPAPTDDLSGLLGYFTQPWAMVYARLPTQHPLMHWSMASEDVRRMFLLFVAEALENP